MEGYLPILFFVAFGVIFVSVMAWSAVKEKKRTEKFRAIAEALGLKFQPTVDARFVSELESFPLFSQGRSKQMKNLVLARTDDVEMRIFDYKYATGSGKNQTTHRLSVACFRAETLNSPKFAVRPENFFHKIGKAFGYQDINFDMHPNFSKAYLLRGEDVDAIRRLFQEGVIPFYEQHQGISTEGAGPLLIFYRASKRIKPEQVEAFMQEGFAVYKVFREASENLK